MCPMKPMKNNKCLPNKTKKIAPDIFFTVRHLEVQSKPPTNFLILQVLSLRLTKFQPDNAIFDKHSYRRDNYVAGLGEFF